MKINFIAYVSTIDGDKWKAGFTAKLFEVLKDKLLHFIVIKIIIQLY